ncbi:MAG TPA: hypothetical protein VF625_15570, partial [Longimicrobium sp.]
MDSSRLAVALLALAGLAACTDELPLNPAPASGPRADAYTKHSSWRGYWHHANELFVYDGRPQLGMNTSFHQETEIAQLVALRARVLRTRIPWDVEAGDPGTAAWTVEPFRRDYGMEMLFQVEEWGGALATFSFDSAARHDQVYVPLRNKMLAMMDSNYSTKGNYGKVLYWQIGNEPDAGCDAGAPYNGSTLTDSGTIVSAHNAPRRYAQGWNYAQMLRVVVPAMKKKARRQNRDIVIVTAGLTGEEGYRIEPTPLDPEHQYKCHVRNASTTNPNDTTAGNESWSFLRGLYAGGGAPYFDILAIHAYGETANGRNSYYSTTSTVSSMLYGVLNDPNRPLWVTEMGTSAGNNSDQLIADGPTNDKAQADGLQAQWYTDAVSNLKVANTVSVMFPYTLRTEEGGNPAGTGLDTVAVGQYGLGITRVGSKAPRPAFDSMTVHAPLVIGPTSGSFRVGIHARVPA